MLKIIKSLRFQIKNLNIKYFIAKTKKLIKITREIKKVY
jgi:hypothetical protein